LTGSFLFNETDFFSAIDEVNRNPRLNFLDHHSNGFAFALSDRLATTIKSLKFSGLKRNDGVLTYRVATPISLPFADGAEHFR
jgi:hypothetical protein